MLSNTKHFKKDAFIFFLSLAIDCKLIGGEKKQTTKTNKPKTYYNL